MFDSPYTFAPALTPSSSDAAWQAGPAWPQSLVALGWPLLPTAWRARVSPAAATAAVSTGPLIMRRLVGRRVR